MLTVGRGFHAPPMKSIGRMPMPRPLSFPLEAWHNCDGSHRSAAGENDGLADLAKPLLGAVFHRIGDDRCDVGVRTGA